MIVKTIIIANIAEAFKDTINKVKSTNQKNKRIQAEHSLCDRTLLWENDNKLIITPFQISTEIFESNKKIFGFKNVDNLYPINVGISLSDSIRKDNKLFKTLCSFIRDNPGVRISPYCITENFIKLTECLAKKDLEFSVVEMPENESIWLVPYLDSKVGSRIEMNKIKGICKNVPESVICKNHKEAINVAIWFYKNNRACVLKANFGESGWGTFFIKKEDFNNENEIIEHIQKEFKSDFIWNDELIVVEEYIVPNKKISANSPSVELILSGDGVKITYLCGQVLGASGDFLGVAMGINLLDNKIKNELRKISFKVGRKFWNLGYRGFFDIDFVLSNNNVPFIIETNMRRTGGTHVYDAAKKLLGSNWEKNYFIMSQDNFCYGDKKLNKNKVMDKMKEIMYPIEGEKEGIIISIINKWKPVLGFVIVGESSEKTLKIYNKMLNILSIKN